MKSTAWYDRNRDAAFARYDALNSDEVHAGWAPEHLPEEPGFACDIGAGSGRDANWLASKGWEVVAVEPSSLREKAAARSHPRVIWLNDALPDLRALRALGRRFDLILLSAVWMHVAPKSRERAFRILSELLGPSGLLVITLRQGTSAAEKAARGFHDISAEEAEKLIAYASRRAIALRSRTTRPSLIRPDLEWETLVFAMPDDGTGSLPLLRHVIVNDDKSSTYKLGLLRTLVHIAETAPGLVIERTDDYVDIPFGAVGLFWLKQYMPLVLHHGLPQRPRGPGGYGWAKDAFYRLEAISPSDLRLGGRFDADRARILTGAIRDACRNIEIMPVRHITHPGAADRQVFESEYSTVRATAKPVVLSREYLAQFGRFRIPAQLWQTLGQYACWLDPVIVREWGQLTAGWGDVAPGSALTRNMGAGIRHGSAAVARVADAARATVAALEWGDSHHDTRVAQERANQLRDGGFPLTCVWSASRIKSSPHIDHCFPWARWPNNDLWNLLPASAKTNLNKGDRLPSSRTMRDAGRRMQDWWEHAWVGSTRDAQFYMEAQYSLPGISGERPSLDEIFHAALHQRARLKQDQQLVEWGVAGR